MIDEIIPRTAPVQASTAPVATAEPGSSGSTPNHPAKNIGSDYNNSTTVNLSGLTSTSDLLNAEPNPIMNLGESDVTSFLGEIEVKPKGSVLWVMLAPKGSGKTHLCMNVSAKFAAAGQRVLFWTLEEHKDSTLFKQKIRHYLKPEHVKNFQAVSEDELYMGSGSIWQNFLALSSHFDVVLVDSWKLLAAKSRDFDINEWRKRLDGKLLGAIIHLTKDGTARGGANIEQDADMVMRLEKFPQDYKKNFAWWEKSRYQHQEAHTLRFSPYYDKILTQEEFEQMHGEGSWDKPFSKLER